MLLPCLAFGETYQVVFLRPDPARTPLAKEAGERIQSAHMANIRSMADRGLLLAAGPFEDKPHSISGVFIFKMASSEAALAEASKDPTVVEHRNLVDVLSWNGPKGVGEEYRRLHKEDPKTAENMGVHPFVLLRGSGGSEHAAYVSKLKQQGKLAASGPVTGDAKIVELLIFERISDEEAAALVAADPAVKAGALSVEAHRWWCAAHVLPR